MTTAQTDSGPAADAPGGNESQEGASAPQQGDAQGARKQDQGKDKDKDKEKDKEKDNDNDKDKDNAQPQKPLDFTSSHSTSLVPLLAKLRSTLLVTTYQAGKLIAVREDQGKLNTHFRNFRSPMGMAFDNGRLAVGTRTEVWEFRNQPDVSRRLEPKDKHDACFLPRNVHFSGDIQIHEIAWGSGELWIVNTRFSCLCTLDRNFSFIPRWRPPWVTHYSPNDRCHLNGLAMVDGKPKYVTVLGKTNTPGGWRANKANGGLLMDVETGRIITEGLSMPHSPRWHDGKLWVLESGRGGLNTVDLETGKVETIATLPGFTRGLDFFGPLAFVGLSQVRETAVFSGIPITESKEERNCGVWVVDTRNGEILGLLRFEGSVQEIFAVNLLLGMRFPDIINDDHKIIGTSYVLPEEALKLVDLTPPPPPPDAEAKAKAKAKAKN